MKKNATTIKKEKQAILLNIDKSNTKKVYSVRLFIVLCPRINLSKQIELLSETSNDIFTSKCTYPKEKSEPWL